MSTSQQDWILRLIERLGVMMQRVFRLREQGEVERALLDVQEAYASLLGPMGETASKVDVESAVQLLDDPLLVVAMARLVAVEAELLEDEGRPADARAQWQRALELAADAYLRDPSDQSKARDVIVELRAHVELDALSPARRDAVASARG